MLKPPSELAQIDKEAGHWKLDCQVINILTNHKTDTQIIQSESCSEYMWQENTERASVKQHKAKPLFQSEAKYKAINIEKLFGT